MPGLVTASLANLDAIQVHSSSGNVAAASAVGTIAPAAGKLAFLSGFEITAGGSTVAAIVNATVAGVLGGTQTHVFAAPLGATVGAAPLVVRYNPPIPASAPGTSIVVTLPSLGAGNTNACVVAHGFYQ